MDDLEYAEKSLNRYRGKAATLLSSFQVLVEVVIDSERVEYGNNNLENNPFILFL